jgi:hypothetical protein
MFLFPPPPPRGGPTGPPDLVADIAALRTAAADLRFVAAEFTRARALVVDIRGDLGHHALSAALDEFATNWRRHRSSIVAGARGLADAADTAGRSYQQVDAGLAGALTERL